MKKRSKITVLTALLASMALFLAGCTSVLDSTDADFAFSYGIDEDGTWKGIDAMKKVDLCEYNQIPVPASVHSVPVESVQAEIDTIMASYTTDVMVTGRSIEDGDTVNIDYIGRVDGVEFAGGNTQEQGTDVTIGVTSYIDDFLEQLIGREPGETFDVEVTFPDDYQEQTLQGKDAVFEVTVNHIIESMIPELNDEFVNDVISQYYGWTTVEEMRTSIASQIQDSAVEQYLQDYLLDNSTVNDLPEILVEYQEYSMIQFYRDYAEYYDMDFSEFILTYTGANSVEELIEANVESTEMTAKLYLLIEAISEDAGISASDDDINAYFNQLMDAENLTAFRAKYGLPHMRMVTTQKKVLEYLIENSVFE